MNLYLKNVWIVTVNETFDVIPHGAVAVEGDTITYAGPMDGFVPDPKKVWKVRDGQDKKFVMPGFVNGHTHLPMSLFRGSADNLPLQTWLDERIFPMEAKHTKETMYWGALLALAELTRCGVTTVNDMYTSVWEITAAMRQSGHRGIVANGLIGVSPEHDVQLREIVEAATVFRNDPMIRIAIGPHAEYTEKDHSLTRALETALDLGLPLHIHASETKKEHEECKQRHGGMTPVAYLNSLGFFQTKVLLAHCVWAENSDLDLIRAGSGSVLHCPCSNMKLGSGFAPVPEMIAKGLSVALATDGAASNNNLDMWEEMRVAALIHKGYTHDAACVSAKEALYLATRGGARALGYEDVGSIEAGMKADLLLVNMDNPAWYPRTDLTNHIVYSGNSRDIEMTVIGGEVAWERGSFERLDAERIYYESDRLYREIFAD